ncbi:MAG: hypothetical protein ACETWR_05190 [Anaerolineae bacterium]
MNLGTETNAELCHLLQIFLECALLGKPYPGQDTPYTFFPDIEIVKHQQEIFVSDRNLGGPCQVEIPGKSIEFLSDEEIQERANAIGDFPYFALTEAEIGQDEATLSLQLAWATSEESKQSGKLMLSGGGVRVRFQCIEGEWQAPMGPMATWMA